MLSEVEGVRVAAVGCAHGSFDEIYELLRVKAEAKGWDNVDLVIIGGDFQALRNASDAACISVPAKWKSMGDFHKYYGGEKVAPYLTIFCGGNHEASNYLFELYYGGWVAPNIYYLGAANLVRFGPLRISAMSGIWKGYDYRKPHFERLPYGADDLHSIYHVRELDVRKLLQVRTQVDVGLSHDWPRGIENFGNSRELFRKKRGFKEDSEHGSLGSSAARDVMDRLRPAYWFAAHLHVKFTAVVPHDGVGVKRVDAPEGQPSEWAVEADMSAKTTTSESSKAGSVGAPRNIPPILSGTSEDFQKGVAAWNAFAAETQDIERREAVKTRQLYKEFQHKREELREQGMATYENERAAYDAVFSKNSDEISLGSVSESDGQASGNPSPAKAAKMDNVPVGISNDWSENSSNWDALKAPASPGDRNPPVEPESTSDTRSHGAVDTERGQAVTEDLRSKLPASFARPAPQAQKPAQEKPVPEAVSNKVTRFLALDKPHNRDDVVHLMKLKAVDEAPSQNISKSSGGFRLQYDKEWLAITRVFAADLVLGDRSAQVPPHKGEDSYRARIVEEEKWVEEHLEKRGLMDIPLNFQLSAPKYDPAESLAEAPQPRECPNNQTADFCSLLDIPNAFALTEEEIEARMNAGPPPASGGSFQGGHGNRGRGRGRGRGNGRGYGRGNGRGRGRGF
ncbi:Lariat debranching enzyme [Penicillium oxalicum]|uniref:Lariat debranching enzyme n=1 Tax=Penicillium oxalicum TaxID=69781 RepID=UPI0020B7D727|nr:Lariat debranching enzyme [Penicillium oxalicum]KAI2789424.1 Lariat debranching enzyme [Penicillium oxalicum]